MKSEWKECTLGDITSLVIDHRGLTPKKLGGDWAKEGYRALSAKNVKTGRIVQSESIKYVSEDMYRKWMPEEIEYGDILITSEAPFGEIYQWNSSEKIVLSQRLFGLRISSELNANYIYYYMTTEAFKGEMKARATGTTVIGLRQPELLKCKIRLPNLQTQNKIASVLRSIDDKIELNTNINENLHAQAQALLSSFFIDFSHFGGTMPNDWEQGTLGDIIDFSNGYAFKSKELLDVPKPDCYQVFKQGHINRGGGFNSSGTKSWYPISQCANLSKFVLHKGDVLMAMTDMKDNVAILGNTALMTVDNEYIVNQRVGLLRSNGYKGTSYAYIYLLTNSFDFLKDLRSRANSGVQVNLSSTEIKASPVWIASNATNEEFNSLTEPLLRMIMVNDSENQRLAVLRDTLLPRLMSGELDVSNLDF